MEFAVVVAGEWQGYGIATYLLHGLAVAAIVAGVYRLKGSVLKENDAMQKLAQALGFSILHGPDDAATVRVVKAPGSPADYQRHAHSKGPGRDATDKSSAPE